MAQVTLIEKKSTFKPFTFSIEIETFEQLAELTRIVGGNQPGSVFTEEHYDLLYYRTQEYEE